MADRFDRFGDPKYPKIIISIPNIIRMYIDSDFGGLPPGNMCHTLLAFLGVPNKAGCNSAKGPRRIDH